MHLAERHTPSMLLEWYQSWHNALQVSLAISTAWGKKNKKINKKSKGSNFSGVRRICPDSSNIEPNWHVLTKLNV